MGRRFTVCACFAAAFAAAVGAAAFGCSAQGSPATPAWSGVELADASVGGDAMLPDAGPSYTVCAMGVEPKFSSLLAKVLDTPSCGTNRTNNCHSTAGSIVTGHGLAFDKDAGDVYAELVGPDGGTVPSRNIAGMGQPPRVVPGDAGASMLYIKLTLKTCSDPTYGCGMPQLNPGSVCPAVLDAVKGWIDQGASND